MANSLSRQEVQQLALLGAQSRLESLRAEIATILRAFPQLGRGGAAVKAASTEAPASRASGGRTRRKRNFEMSDAQKRAVSERMKKYWAGRRKDKGTPRTSAARTPAKATAAKAAAKAAAKKAG